MNEPIATNRRKLSSTLPRRAERGSALVLAILVLVLLSATGVALLTVGQNEMKMGAASLNSKSVYYLAEAGIEDGRATLLTNGLSLTDSLVAAAGPNGVIDFDPELVEPVYDADGNFVEFSGTGDDVPLRADKTLGPGTYAAFLSNDIIDPDPVVDANERVVISGLAAGQGQAFEVVQAMVEPRPLFPEPPCAITLLGPSPVFSAGADDCAEILDDEDEDNDGDFEGEDCDGDGIPGYEVPTVCVGGFIDYIGEVGDADETGDEFDDEDYDDLAAAAKAKVADEFTDDACPGNFETATYSGVDTIANLDDFLNEPMLGGGYDLEVTWTDCYELRRLVEKVRDEADFVCTDPSCEIDKSSGWADGSAPTLTTSSVTLVDGDLAIPAGYAGNGLLVVTGAVDFDASGSWTGPILVIGEGELIRTGSGGTGALSGATVVANIAGADGTYGTADDCHGGTHGFGTAVYAEHDDQEGDTTFCSDDVAQATPIYSYEPR
jgi:hypothetical protein